MQDVKFTHSETPLSDSLFCQFLHSLRNVSATSFEVHDDIFPVVDVPAVRAVVEVRCAERAA